MGRHFLALTPGGFSVCHFPTSLHQKAMHKLILPLGLGVLFPTLFAIAAGAPGENRCYELRTYYAAPGKLDALNARFRDHTMKIFEKHGMINVGYWTPVENPDNKLIYVLAFPSRDIDH